MLEKIHQVKIVIVATHYSIIDDRGKNFVDLLERIIKIFPEIDPILTSFCLIITKIKDILDFDETKELLTENILEP